MAKKHQLVLTPEIPDAGVIGLVCQFPDYRLVHFMNKVLHYNLEKIGALTVTVPNLSEPAHFAHFHWTDEAYRISFSLLANKDQGIPLLPVVRNIDFLLIMMDLNNRYDVGGVIRSLRAIRGVLMVQPIPSDRIPKFGDLLNLIELQLLQEKSNAILL